MWGENWLWQLDDFGARRWKGLLCLLRSGRGENGAGAAALETVGPGVLPLAELPGCCFGL